MTATAAQQQPGQRKFYGKYKGTVFNNLDPELRGRIQALVPGVLGPGVPSSFCEPCVPLAGPTGAPMGAYFVPPIGAGVWIEFEGGDVDLPILAGCRFEAGDPPPLAHAGLPVSPSIVLQTALQNTIVISDLPGPAGGIILKSTTGVMLIVNDTGIYMQNGKGAMITLLGPAVTVNAGALVVT